MAIKCPACGKASNVEVATTACSRCGCDLALLRRMAHTSDYSLSEAVAWLREGEWERAFWLARQSWELCHRPPSARVAFLAAAALGDADQLLLWRRRARLDDEDMQQWPPAGRS